MEVMFSIKMTVEDDAWETLKQWEHHAEYLLDLDSYPEIKSIYDCKVEKLEERK